MNTSSRLVVRAAKSTGLSPRATKLASSSGARFFVPIEREDDRVPLDAYGTRAARFEHSALRPRPDRRAPAMRSAVLSRGPRIISFTSPFARSEPASITATLSQTSDSSVRMCDEIKTALPDSASAVTSSRSSTRARGSRPAAGSSRMSSAGSCKSVLRDKDAAVMPLDRASMFFCSSGVSAVNSITPAIDRWRSFPRNPWARAKKSRYSSTVVAL